MSSVAMEKVGELAANQSGAISVFERFGIEYCCGGKRTLAFACDQAGVSLDEVITLLRQGRGHDPTGDRDWRNAPLAALTEHIIATHHVFTRESLVRLERLFEQVKSRHSEDHPESRRLQELFLELKDDMLPHMLKEEQVLFPYIERLERAVQAGREVNAPYFDTVRNPVRLMVDDHATACDLLREMRETAGNYAIRTGDDEDVQRLYAGLADLEANLHQHIHLENNLLFPRAIQTENEANPGLQSNDPKYGLGSLREV